MRDRSSWIMALAMLFGIGAPAFAEEPKRNPEEEAALLKNAGAFVEAFHNGDAKKLASFWTPDGDYTSQTGRHVKGRENIEKAFKEFFAEHKGMKLRIDIISQRFITPDVAVEDGTTDVIPPDGDPPTRARYTIVHVKQGGKWMLSSVRDAQFFPATNYEHLRELEWAIGDWADESEKGAVGRLSFTWSENQNFMINSFATTLKNIALSSGTQWIGYDASTKKIRSWTFDASGSFAEGTWSREGKKWTIKSTSTTREGKKATATNIVTLVDADTITWQSRDRMADGKELPDIKEIKLKRVK